MDNNRIAEIADNAADFIEEHGWCQNALFDLEGRVCMRGALLAGNETLCAAGQKWDADREREAINVEPMILDYIGAITVPDWNDTGGRTKDEVVTVLRDVATKYRSDEMNVSANEAQC